MIETAILLFSCPDAPGIVASLTNFIWHSGGNIMHSDQHSTNPTDGQFFIRLEFCFDPQQTNASFWEKGIGEIAARLQADAKLYYKSQTLRMGILVSKYDHCLVELLYQWSCKEIDVSIPFIISNHDDCKKIADQYRIPFHYLPITANNKQQQAETILNIARDTTDFLVLARYMQILSNEFLEKYNKDIINIHHSFLPSFIGANPYQQAYDRGVKIIGATAHYVTAELDEGPIIEQMVQHVSHQDSVDSLRRKGKNLEKLTLAKAVEEHAQHRIIRWKNKTIVFG